MKASFDTPEGQVEVRTGPSPYFGKEAVILTLDQASKAEWMEPGSKLAFALPKPLARAIASALMGAAAEIK